MLGATIPECLAGSTALELRLSTTNNPTDSAAGWHVRATTATHNILRFFPARIFFAVRNSEQ